MEILEREVMGYIADFEAENKKHTPKMGDFGISPGTHDQIMRDCEALKDSAKLPTPTISEVKTKKKLVDHLDELEDPTMSMEESVNLIYSLIYIFNLEKFF